MLFAFYSTLIIFLILAIVTAGVLIFYFTKKKLTTANTIALVVLLCFCLVITVIYSSDFIQLKSDGLKEVSGSCELTYIKGRKSINTTEIVFDGQKYSIKSDKYKSVEDGTYVCELQYLPLTKIVTGLTIR